jgi:predicted AlkP superfamily phosphohydrolase/phosphomutase
MKKEGRAPMGRILVIGLDGTDFDVLEPLLAQGTLPNLARLFEGGSHGELRSTYPPMSPPAWTSFMTGKNPGKHGIFDFTTRRPGSYDVEFTNARLRRAATAWRLMSDAGKRVCVLSVPMTFPPEPLNGIQISGFDTPGVSGGLAEPNGMHPPELHQELGEKLGGYFISPHIKNMQGSPDAFVAEAYRTIDRKMETARYLYAKEAWDCFMITIGETDAVSHRLWHYHDKKSPLGDGDSRSYSGASPLVRVYERIDEHLGKLLKAVDDQTTVFVVSDHGHAGNGDKAIYLNRWLQQHGMLRLDTSLRRRLIASTLGLAKRAGTKNIVPVKYRKKAHRAGLAGKLESWLRFARLDWSRTRAYSEETPYYPTIWLNVKGREPQGVVEPGAEYDRVRDELIRELAGWKDPETGRPLVKRAYKREELYSGPFLDRIPDLVLEWNMDGDYSYLFRTTHPSSGHRPTVERVTENEKASAKSGDHRDNGILIAHGKAVAPGSLTGAQIIDIAPTFLHLVGLPVPADMDGRVLTEIFKEDFVRAHPVQQTGEVTSVAASDLPGEYSEEEQEAVRKRLQGLGYME